LFYDYVKGNNAQSDFTQELDSSISRLKEEKEERKMYLTYTSRMMECRRDGYEEGLSIGLERGVHQKALETARKLLARGDSPAEIADLLSLPVSQVQELVENR
jgi:predicted transposase/invertase (TIGR01784 family)